MHGRADLRTNNIDDIFHDLSARVLLRGSSYGARGDNWIVSIAPRSLLYLFEFLTWKSARAGTTHRGSRRGSQSKTIYGKKRIYFASYIYLKRLKRATERERALI